MTYRQLLERGCEYLGRDGMGDQQVKNMASALRRWTGLHGYSDERSLGDDFGQDFDKQFSRFCDLLQDGNATRTQKDRQEQLLRWRRIAQALRQTDTLPASFAEALSHCVRASRLTRGQVCRSVGITVKQLEYWCSGNGQPRADLVKVVPQLEKVLELPVDTLLHRLPLARRSRYLRGQAKHDRTTSFTKTRRAQRKGTGGSYAATFEGQLATQWQDLLMLKCDSLREHARARNTWRTKPIHRIAIRVEPWMLVGDHVCPTASVQWGIVSSYLGWLSLPRPAGPAKAEDGTRTLAWLADPVQVIAYARWMIARSGNRFHNGVNVTLQTVESYLRPETGFVWLRPDLRGTAPDLKLLESPHPASLPPPGDESARWQEHCALARQKICEFRVRAEDSMKVKPSRDPQERIVGLLQDEFPLKRLVEFVHTLQNSAPPPAHHRDYVAWIRDVTLCRLLMSNPLRISQYAAMTFKEDGSGNLVRIGPGQYRMHFDAADFKNEKGAAKDDYDVAVDETVSPWIDRYLVEARPHMADAEATSRFFLTAVRGPRRKNPAFLEERGLREEHGARAESLYRRLMQLTATYIPDCKGFGPHAYRHIIATDHLRRHPGDYLTVATLLHDMLETVLKNYGHLKVADGLRVLSRGIREATEQLSRAPAAAAPSTTDEAQRARTGA